MADQPGTTTEPMAYGSEETYGDEGHVWPYPTPPRRWSHELQGYPPGPGRPKGSRRVDLSGSTYKHLSVQERVEDARGSKAQYRCLCDCGEEVVVRGDNLTSGRTTSCGHVGWAEPYSVIGRPVPVPVPDDWRDRAARAGARHVASERRRNGS